MGSLRLFLCRMIHWVLGSFIVRARRREPLVIQFHLREFAPNSQIYLKGASPATSPDARRSRFKKGLDSTGGTRSGLSGAEAPAGATAEIERGICAFCSPERRKESANLY